MKYRTNVRYNQKRPMYYRRKILLALIEVFGGSLKSTDCEKLLFNFCQQSKKNHYDFFPHRFGPFSIMSYYDRRRLIELGLLKPTDDFQLNTQHSYLNELTPIDKAALLRFKSYIGNLRGDKLVKKTYQDFPQFTLRSKIVDRYFTAEELNERQFAFTIDTMPTVFSIGYEGLTIDSFLYKLIANNSTLVVDVRNNPQSMKYGFSKKTFKHFVESAGMKYIHIPELGIPSTMRKGLGESVSHKTLFKAYETKLLPKQETEIKQLIDLTNQNERAALVCFEADHNLCHRHTLIEHLQKNKSFKRSVTHL